MEIIIAILLILLAILINKELRRGNALLERIKKCKKN